MAKKRKVFEELGGVIPNLGTRRKNVLLVRRKLKSKGFKGTFKISLLKDPRSVRNVSLKFKALRRR